MSEFPIDNIRAPFNYISKLPGKLVRTQLITFLNDWIGTDESFADIISKTIEMLHNASLLIDDIEDSSEFRRGAKAAHVEFGMPLTVNSANLIFFEALKDLQVLKLEKLASIFSDEMINLHLGQGMEIYYRDNRLRPSMEQYYRISALKTGGLFKLSAKLLCECANLTDKKGFSSILDLTEKLGQHYQLKNDYSNIFKSNGDDLREGKFTAPTIFAELDRVKYENFEERETIIKYLIEIEADKFCLNEMARLSDEILRLVDEIDTELGKKNDRIRKFIESL